MGEDSGDLTPVSTGSEWEFNTNDTTMTTDTDTPHNTEIKNDIN